MLGTNLQIHEVSKSTKNCCSLKNTFFKLKENTTLPGILNFIKVTWKCFVLISFVKLFFFQSTLPTAKYYLEDLKRHIREGIDWAVSQKIRSQQTERLGFDEASIMNDVSIQTRYSFSSNTHCISEVFATGSVTRAGPLSAQKKNTAHLEHSAHANSKNVPLQIS